MNKKILVINASPNRLEKSFSRRLSKHFVDKIQEQFPHRFSIEEIDLELDPPVIIDKDNIGAFSHSPETEKEQAFEAYSERMIEKLKSSDGVIISTPMYNFTVTASLKSWIDGVVRSGQTYQYTKNGPEGLVKDRPLMIVASYGGSFLSTLDDHVVPYLKTVFRFIGFDHFETAVLENASRQDAENALKEAQSNAENTIEDFINKIK